MISGWSPQRALLWRNRERIGDGVSSRSPKSSPAHERALYAKTLLVVVVLETLWGKWSDLRLRVLGTEHLSYRHEVPHVFLHYLPKKEVDPWPLGLPSCTMIQLHSTFCPSSLGVTRYILGEEPSPLKRWWNGKAGSHVVLFLAVSMHLYILVFGCICTHGCPAHT